MSKPKRITKIVRTEQLKNTPAAVDRSTGVLYIKPSVFDKLPKEHQAFVLLHEKAHLELDTENEFLADAEAFRQYTKLGYPLSQSIYALSRVLTMQSPEHEKRVWAQLQRAKEFDESVNYQGKVKTTMDRQDNLKKHYVNHKYAMLEAVAKGDLEAAKKHLEEVLKHVPINERAAVRAKHLELFESAQKLTKECSCQQKMAAFQGGSDQGSGSQSGQGGGSFDPSAWGSGIGALLGGVSTIIDSASGNTPSATQPTVIVQQPQSNSNSDNKVWMAVAIGVIVLAVLATLAAVVLKKKS